MHLHLKKNTEAVFKGIRFIKNKKTEIELIHLVVFSFHIHTIVFSYVYYYPSHT